MEDREIQIGGGGINWVLRHWRIPSLSSLYLPYLIQKFSWVVSGSAAISPSEPGARRLNGFGLPIRPFGYATGGRCLADSETNAKRNWTYFFCKTRVMQFYVAFMQFIHLLLALFMQVRFQSVVARLMERSSHLWRNGDFRTKMYNIFSVLLMAQLREAMEAVASGRPWKGGAACRQQCFF